MERNSVLKIPFNKPYRAGPEIRYIHQALREGHLSGDGFFTKKCSVELSKRLNSAAVLLTPSGTHALELAALLMETGPGDEFIVPSFTFPSTANAFVLRGGIPRFVDIRPDTLNIDENLVEAQINRRTRALIPIHYGGIAARLDVLAPLARRRGLFLIEDAAQALGGSLKGKPLGSWGALNALSFHETKNFQCGEGGALVLQDARFLRRAEIIRQKGTNRAQFNRGEIDKYSWVDMGSSFVPSELQSAYLYAQLERFQPILQRRRRLWETYQKALTPLEQRGDLRLPRIPLDTQSSYHTFSILVESKKVRDALLSQLKHRGILAVFHYFPLHLSKMGRHFGGKPGLCPVSESVSDRLIRLPLYNGMTAKDQSLVIRTVNQLL